jgi:hypothetical protein
MNSSRNPVISFFSKPFICKKGIRFAVDNAKDFNYDSLKVITQGEA